MLRHRLDTRSLSLFLEVIGHSLVLVWKPASLQIETGAAGTPAGRSSPLPGRMQHLSQAFGQAIPDQSPRFELSRSGASVRQLC
jgi:hypothetical protein